MNDHDFLTTETLLAEAQIGQEAEDWINSQIGQYVVGCANQEINDCMEQLKWVDPDDSKLIRDLQLRIASRELAVRWIMEIIDRGNDAFQMLNTEQ
jgi:hypothetical protein